MSRNAMVHPAGPSGHGTTSDASGRNPRYVRHAGVPPTWMSPVTSGGGFRMNVEPSIDTVTNTVVSGRSDGRASNRNTMAFERSRVPGVAATINAPRASDSVSAHNAAVSESTRNTTESVSAVHVASATNASSATPGSDHGSRTPAVSTRCVHVALGGSHSSPIRYRRSRTGSDRSVRSVSIHMTSSPPMYVGMVSVRVLPFVSRYATAFGGVANRARSRASSDPSYAEAMIRKPVSQGRVNPPIAVSNSRNRDASSTMSYVRTRSSGISTPPTSVG